MGGLDDIDDRAATWVAAGIIDPAQAERIVAHEREAVAGSEHHARARVQALFGVLGTLLVALGVLLTTIANWDRIGDGARLALLVGMLVLSQLAGIVADARRAPRWVGTIAFAAELLVFGGGIFVLAELYNVDAHPPLGLALIGAFGAAIAVLVDRMVVGWLAAIGLVGWPIHELALAYEQLDDESMSVQLLAGVVLSMLAAITIGWALSGVARRAGVAGGSGVAVLAQRLDVVAVPLRVLATGALAFALVQASLAWHMGDLDGAVRIENLLAAVVALVGVTACWRHAPIRHRGAVAGSLAGAGSIVLVLAAWPDDLVVSVLASALLAIGGIGMFILGMLESRRELFGWGIAWLVLLVVSRYLDFMVSVDLGGPGFIGAGLLLLVIAVLVGRSRSLWRRRGEVVG